MFKLIFLKKKRKKSDINNVTNSFIASLKKEFNTLLTPIRNFLICSTKKDSYFLSTNIITAIILENLKVYNKRQGQERKKYRHKGFLNLVP